MTKQQMDTVGAGRGGRMSRQWKRDAVLRLLRGEDLDTVSRSLLEQKITLLEGNRGPLARQRSRR